MPKRHDTRRPTVDDVDPEALAVNAMDDETRTHREGGETEAVQSTSGDVMPVDSEDQPEPPSRADREPADEDEGPPAP